MENSVRKSVTVREAASAHILPAENQRFSFSNMKSDKKRRLNTSPSPTNQSRLMKSEFDSPLADLDQTGRLETVTDRILAVEVFPADHVLPQPRNSSQVSVQKSKGVRSGSSHSRRRPAEKG